MSLPGIKEKAEENQGEPKKSSVGSKRSVSNKLPPLKLKKSSGRYKHSISNKSPPSSPLDISLLTDFEVCWLNSTCLPENHNDNDITFQEVSDLSHPELTAPSAHKVALNCPNSSSAEKAVSNLQDSSFSSKAMIV